MDEDSLKKLNEIQEELRTESTKIIQMLKILLKQKSDKLTGLEDELRRKKILTSRDVQDAFDISRNWALNLMRALSKSDPNIVFVLGDKKCQRPSRLLFKDNPDFKNFEVIKQLIEEQGYATIKCIKEKFGLSRREANLFAENFCAYDPIYKVDESLLFNDTRIPTEEGIRLIKKPLNG